MKSGTIAFPIADGVEDLEFYVTKMRLEEAGYKVISAGITKESVVGKNGLLISVDSLLTDLKANDLIGLVLAGGWAPDKLRRYDYINELIKEVHQQGK